MSRSRIVTLAAAVGIGAVLAASWYRMSPRAQTGPAVRSEHWPELGLDPHGVVFENGFRIVLIEDHRVARVAASLQCRFGALSERNGEHGSAHFLEHAMHQGTTTVGVKDRDVDRRNRSRLVGEHRQRPQNLSLPPESAKRHRTDSERSTSPATRPGSRSAIRCRPFRRPTRQPSRS